MTEQMSLVGLSLVSVSALAACCRWAVCMYCWHVRVGSCQQVPTRGLLNTIAAPQLGQGSPYQAMRSKLAPPLAPPQRALLWVCGSVMHWSDLPTVVWWRTHTSTCLPMLCRQTRVRVLYWHVHAPCGGCDICACFFAVTA